MTQQKLNTMKTFFANMLLATSLLILTGCGSVGEKISHNLDGAFLNKYVGKNYATLVDERPMLGKVYGKESLNDGSVVMKHLGEGGESGSDAGFYNSKTKLIKATYLKVKDGVIEDWATALIEGSKTKCWVGFCGKDNADDMANVDIDAVDGVVLTKDKKPYSSWK